MKRFLLLLPLIAILFTACEGEQGPPGFDGFDGQDGQDGGLIVASAFEIIVDFNASNNFEFTESYGFDVFPSDVTLVYIEWETAAGESIWRLLPQTTYLDDGILVYNYDFSQDDVRVFLDGTTNFNTLDSSFTQDQLFRVVVVPADNVDGLDTSNLDAVLQANHITAFDQR